MKQESQEFLLKDLCARLPYGVKCYGFQMKIDGNDNECMLFPSKENRDWSTFKLKKPKFDPKSLQPFDKVLVRNNHTEHWNCNIFSFVYNEKIIRTAHGSYVQVIPYNNETKHLVGTKNDCPEFYKWWE